ncbi:MAG: tRNA (adenosine(37)-N6)-dimethylallyltransferase MiaA [Candidatus Omnitrophota bacterium]|nr:tRNA (adenosine(37)-N6)-dimethylallyltransferase MiaA [Candidatus Omnitrophota bacterium]
MKPLVLFLVGPTGVGKSALAVTLASRIGGEIVSADSMQVYRGMSIGTAKPLRRDRRQVPHHLIDVRSPGNPFSVYEYQRLALKKISSISKRGKVPIVVGGTGLYIRSLLEGLSGQPGADPKFRARLEKEIRTGGLKKAYARLIRKDACAAERIKPSDKRRIIRALEIAELSGKKPSYWRGRGRPLTALGFEPRVIGITQERSQLYASINARVDRMFRAGLLAEVRRLAQGRLSRTASQAVGYKELLPHVRNNRTADRVKVREARELIKRNSRRLAKRQWTWFKKEKGIVWMTWTSDMRPDVFCGEILKTAHV